MSDLVVQTKRLPNNQCIILLMQTEDFGKRSINYISRVEYNNDGGIKNIWTNNDVSKAMLFAVGNSYHTEETKNMLVSCDVIKAYRDIYGQHSACYIGTPGFYPASREDALKHIAFMVFGKIANNFNL